MPLFLKTRNTELQERMDSPDCNLVKLKNTYKQFRWINQFLSRWNTLYKNEIRPVLELQNGTATLLDIGFGGGDIPIHLYKLAKKDGYHLNITAIETDKRSVKYARSLNAPSNIKFEYKHSKELVKQGEKFDFVISNHLLHHLTRSTLQSICNEAEQLAEKKVIFNDLSRSDVAYSFFYVSSNLIFWNSFISYDGLISIKRSYTFQELTDIAPTGWKVQKYFPYRLILIYE
ncbi:MAG: methyltransferase domain-containing protein [Balneola sp.]